MHLVGDRFAVARNILARYTAGSNEVSLFSSWGIKVVLKACQPVPNVVYVLYASPLEARKKARLMSPPSDSPSQRHADAARATHTHPKHNPLGIPEGGIDE